MFNDQDILFELIKLIHREEEDNKQLFMQCISELKDIDNIKICISLYIDRIDIEDIQHLLNKYTSEEQLDLIKLFANKVA